MLEGEVGNKYIHAFYDRIICKNAGLNLRSNRSRNYKNPAYLFRGKRNLRLDINLAGQILQQGTVENLSASAAVLLYFLETDGKCEVQLMPPQI